MPMDPRLMRPKPPKATGPEQDPPVQLKSESNLVLVAENDQQITTG